MIFPLVATAVLLLATLIPAALFALVRLALRKPQRRYWRSVLWLHLGLLPLHLFVTFPVFIGWVGSRVVGTRPQERAYQGPRLTADGELLIQTWDSLTQEQQGALAVDPALAAAAAARQVTIESTDGVTLRSFRIAPRREPPRAVVVMVHGLFRSAMELEPPAAMFHRLGCEVWTLELRNHGGSSRAPFTAGLRESDDVVAAAAKVRGQPGRARTPLILFGVSLGTAAVSLAAVRVPDLGGLVLDAPMADLRAAAHRMLGIERTGKRANLIRLVEPWQTLVLTSLQQWSHFDVDQVRPAQVLQSLPPTLPVLVIAAGDDDRMPVEVVRKLYDDLPMAEGVKTWWLQPGAHHGKVWEMAPAEYQQHLEGLLGRVVSAGR